MPDVPSASGRPARPVPVPPEPGSRLALYALAATAPVLLAMLIGGLVTAPNLRWYATLPRPSFGPPNWVFGPVWTLLYGLMAWAFFRVLRRPAWMPDRPEAIRAFVAQILLNALWPAAFFGAHSPRLGLAVIVLLFAAVVVCGRRFAEVDRLAGWCFVPYGIWVLFALLINLSIYIRS